MTTINFPGVAPIPKGSRVRMIVDNVNNPKTATMIEDSDRGIRYGQEEPSKGFQMEGRAPFIKAKVTAVFVHVTGGTDITVTEVVPE